MKHTFSSFSSFYLFFILFLILLLYLLWSYFYKVDELYCNRIPSSNAFGAQNDKNVDTTYGPQDNVANSNCDKYWKEFPNEANTDFLEDIPLDRNMAYNQLPFTAQAGAGSYSKGIIDYNQLIPLVNDQRGIDPMIIEEEYDQLLINPENGKDEQYEYELKYDLYALNKKTWIHRAKEFDPTKKNVLTYDKITSPIDDVNQLNMLFISRVNDKQKSILSNQDLITFGTTNFYIYKYMIQSIRYHKNDRRKIIYTIKIVIFRENDVFTPTLFYQGYVDKSGPTNEISYKIFNATYIGANESSNYLMLESAGLRKSSQKYFMLNDNYRHDDEDYYRDVDKEVAKRKEYLKQFDLKEAYACFNTDFNVYLHPTHKSNIILPYLSRQQCEAPFDFYGRVKPKGIFDKPCKSDDECPFFQANKNYPNQRGKCLPSGQCELPVNMIPIGYHYFVPHPKYQPMCYNCNSSKNETKENGTWISSTKLDTCCTDQYHKNIESESEERESNKYAFLHSPDYAFEGDIEERANHYNQLHTRVYPNQKNKIVVKE